MERITKRGLFEECKSYLDNGEMSPNFDKEYVSVEDVDNLFEKYEINLQEEASTKWNSEEERKIAGIQLGIIRKLHDELSQSSEVLNVKNN